jgi:hypothetical protein
MPNSLRLSCMRLPMLLSASETGILGMKSSYQRDQTM